MVTFPSLVARGGGVTLPPFSTKEGGEVVTLPLCLLARGGEVVTLPPSISFGQNWRNYQKCSLGPSPKEIT